MKSWMLLVILSPSLVTAILGVGYHADTERWVILVMVLCWSALTWMAGFNSGLDRHERERDRA